MFQGEQQEEEGFGGSQMMLSVKGAEEEEEEESTGSSSSFSSTSGGGGGGAPKLLSIPCARILNKNNPDYGLRSNHVLLEQPAPRRYGDFLRITAGERSRWDCSVPLFPTK